MLDPNVEFNMARVVIVRYIDREEMLDALERLGIRENTIVYGDSLILFKRITHYGLQPNRSG